MANIALTTIGIKVGYALDAALTRNASGKITAVSAAVWLEDIKSTPALNPEREALETTVLSETEMKTYAQGLMDMGGSIEFTSNMTTVLKTEWDKFYAGTTTVDKEGAIVIWHPDLTESYVIPCLAQPYGVPEAGVNTVWEQTLRVTPTNAMVSVTAVEPTAPVTAVVGGGN